MVLFAIENIPFSTEKCDIVLAVFFARSKIEKNNFYNTILYCILSISTYFD